MRRLRLVRRGIASARHCPPCASSERTPVVVGERGVGAERLPTPYAAPMPMSDTTRAWVLGAHPELGHLPGRGRSRGLGPRCEGLSTRSAPARTGPSSSGWSARSREARSGSPMLRDRRPRRRCSPGRPRDPTRLGDTHDRGRLGAHARAGTGIPDPCLRRAEQRLTEVIARRRTTATPGLPDSRRRAAWACTRARASGAGARRGRTSRTTSGASFELLQFWAPKWCGTEKAMFDSHGGRRWPLPRARRSSCYRCRRTSRGGSSGGGTAGEAHLQRPDVADEIARAVAEGPAHPDHRRPLGWPRLENLLAMVQSVAGADQRAAQHFRAIGDLRTEDPWTYLVGDPREQFETRRRQGEGRKRR